ncbi:MAG TPA: cobalamin-dependent protein [Candidatus Limnocylindrales bacterium]|nr:cobalamin-dependent protein [Candidatus Limnocylindrales bacterium]
MRPLRIYLADLLHPANVMKTFPYAAGCVGAHALQEHGDRVSVEVFRSPEDLGRAFLRQVPDVLGLTNYVWNLDLARQVASRARQMAPAMTVVMGGPNYPGTPGEQQAFFAAHPHVDFYVAKEGEEPFAALLGALLEHDGDACAVRASGTTIAGVHYMREGRLVAPPPAPRRHDLDHFPSPYLTGLLDSFFARPDLSPLLQTQRGCPFQCTFCVEGEDYYTRIATVSPQRVRAELEYIASRMQPGASPMLYIADSNFGMYEHDLVVCDHLAAVRERYGWPQTIEVSTGKNRKERVLEAVRRTGGAMRFGPALQSTDPQTLRNVRRSNISDSVLLEMAAAAGETGQRSFTELILGLPGESAAAHRASIRTAMEASVQRIKMYALVLLPGTEMAQADSRRRFGLRTGFRVQPYCHGRYEFAGQRFFSAEECELVFGTDAMSPHEYLDCKRFELSVEIFYNDGYFEELHGLARALGISLFDVVQRCHERAVARPELRAWYDVLEQGVREGLFATAAELRAHLADDARADRYAAGEYRNSLGTVKAMALLECVEPLLEVAGAALRECVEAAGKGGDAVDEYIEEMLRYSLLRRQRVLETELAPEADFRFAFDHIRSRQFRVDPAAFRLPRPRRMRFWHDRQQAEDIRSLCSRERDPAARARSFLYPASDPGTNPYLRRSEFC